MNALVQAKGLVKRFTDTQEPAVRGIDLVIERGEFVAIMGPSGSGKSTLVNMVAGLDRPTEGAVWFNGARIDLMSEAALARLRRRRVGVVFQFFNLLPTLSAAENVELPMRLIGRGRSRARKESAQLLADLGLAGKEDAAPRDLSGGQQQRVAVARALANAPDLLVADEPTGNLDSVAARDVLTLLQQSHVQGQTVLIVTHDARVAAAADRVITVRDGLVVDDVTLGPARPVELPFDAGPA
jgi:putative ABC transport system ATP-binding protein